jgi:uncharacterized protein (DUF2147 family)
MRINATTVQVAAIAAALLTTGAARADNSPLGLWIDHTGRGAVEVKECNGNKVCGHIVWLKDNKNLEACGEQVLGDVKPVGGGKWDNGWIYDPDAESKYDVELTPLGDKMKVVGYAGSKWLSETMTWKRAPADLQRCSKGGSAATAPATTDTKAATATPPVQPQADNKDAGKDVSKDAKQAEATPAPGTANPAPAPQDSAKAESKPEETAKAEPQVEPKDEPKAESNGDNAKPRTDNDDSAKNDDDDNDKEDNPKSGKALKKIAEAMNFKKLKNGKCKMDVPFVDMKVTFDCDQ